MEDFFKFCGLLRISKLYYRSSNLLLDLKMWEKFESNLPVCLPSAVALLSMICLIWKMESSGWTETSRIIPVCKKHWTSTKSTMNSSLKYKVYENYLDWKEEKWEYLFIIFFLYWILRQNEISFFLSQLNTSKLNSN